MTTRDVSTELCHINRKHLLSPTDTQSHVDLTAATGNPIYPHRNSKLYKAVIHDKVRGQQQGIKEPIQEDVRVEKSPGPKMGNGRDPFGHRELWQERIPEEPEEIEDVTNTSPPGVASVLQHQVSSSESSVCSSPENGGVRLVREIATTGNGYIDDFAMSPVYETIGARKVQAVSLTVTPPSDNNDSGTYNSPGESRSLDEVNDALNYLDSLETEGSTGYQSNDDIDYSAPGSPRSIDSDVTTFGRRSATYDLTAADIDSALGVGDNTRRSPGDNKGYSPSDNNGCAVGDNVGHSSGDNKGYSPSNNGCAVGDNEGFSPGDNRGCSPDLDVLPATEGGSEGDLDKHPPPVFVPPPPPSDSPPPEDGNVGIMEREGGDGGTKEDPIPEATFVLMQPDIVIESPKNVAQNSDISDTIGDVSPSQDSDHSSDTMPDPGTLPGIGDDASLDEGDSDTESVSTSGQFDLPDVDVDDTDQQVIVLLDKSHRSLGEWTLE